MGTPVLAGLIAADVQSILEVVGTVGALALALAAGVAMIVWARKTWRQDAEGPTTEDPLEIYQHLLDEGIIDAAEFERICARLQEGPPEPAEPAPDAPATSVRPGLPPRPTDLRAGPPPSEPPSPPTP